jgi:hypothetical protein
MARSLTLNPEEPLRDARYERFAQLRVIGLTPEAAAWDAPIRTRDGRPILTGNAWRIDRRPDVRARKAYLAGDDGMIIRETRKFVRDRLMKAAGLDILKQFGIVETVERDGKTFGRLVGVDWSALQASEASIAIASFKFDKDTGLLVDFARDDALSALNQLRDMYGLKGTAKHEITGS